MTNTKTPIDRLLDCLESMLRSRHDADGFIQRWLRRMRALAGFFTWTYVLLLGIALAGIEWWGERNWLLSFLLFSPPQAFLLPLALLTPFCLLLRPKLGLAHLGCVVFVLLVFMKFGWGRSVTVEGPAVTVLTNNIGDNGRASMAPFVTAESPDLLALQDATARGPAYARTYTNYFVASREEFVLISKWKVTGSGVVPIYATNGLPVAAWFEVDYPGRPFVVYNVHLPSPRRHLESMKGIGFLAALAGREGRFGSKLRKDNQDFWIEQVALAEKLVAAIQKEKRPVVVAGDFNVPDHGVIYHLFGNAFTDAFVKRGSGYGHTLPGTTRNPLTLFGPWLRLDKIYCNEALQPVYCRAEPDRKSQHRAVAARFRFADKQ